jgi:type I restriction enzyme S subunit
MPAAHSSPELEARKFRPYPKYKDSGIEWLGQIPAHWDIYPLRRRLFKKAASIKIGPFGSQLKLEFMSNDGFKVYGQEHVIARDFRRGNKYINKAKFDELSACEIRPNDLMVTMMGSSGHSAVVPGGIEPGIMDSHLLRVRLTDCALDIRYVALLINDSSYIRDQIVTEGKGAIMQGLNSSIIKSLILAVPPPTEQHIILTFLDRDIAKIDALIAKKERLIELLQEKRTALITQAVTKGLDPHVPMKDSGIEWLGKIPRRWKVTALKRVASIKYGLGEPPQLLADGIPFVRATNVTKGRIIPNEMQFVDPKDVPWHRNPVLRSGDIIVVRSGAYTGDSAIIPTKYEGAIAGYDMVMRPQQGTSSRFLAWALLSQYILEGQIELQSLRAAQPHLNAEELGAILVFCPPEYEQTHIASFLDRETAKIDDMLIKIHEAIERLKEYRTALISAAVTGKIDLR